MNIKYFLASLLLFVQPMPFSFARSPKFLPVPDSNASYTRYEIKPSLTDQSITNADYPHLVLYDAKARQGKLMVFLQGTGGRPVKGPKDYFNTVVEQGYRLIALSYIDEPAVAQICVGSNLEEDPNCADEFRKKRIYGWGKFALIADEPQDAIMNRLVKLLQYLALNDTGGHWGQYLEKDALKMKDIAFSGQSQGGGMSEYIGKHQLVYKVISFSGGWDWSASGRIARWYATDNVTPPEAWYGTYHMEEPTADYMAMHYKALKMPEGHIHGFKLPVRPGKKPHGEGISNTVYKPVWIEMLGRGN